MLRHFVVNLQMIVLYNIIIDVICSNKINVHVNIIIIIIKTHILLWSSSNIIMDCYHTSSI